MSCSHSQLLTCCAEIAASYTSPAAVDGPLLTARHAWPSPLRKGGRTHYVMYPKFNGSHFGLPPSSIPKMTGLGGKMV